MAKRSRKRPSRHERDRTGCMWGLISIFDLRHGRSTRRLLSDTRQVSKQSVDAGHSSAKTILAGPTEKCEDAVDADVSKMPTADVLKTSVKELMEEEMFIEQHSKNQSNDSEKGLNQIDSKCGQHMKKNHLRKNRICNKSSDMDAFEFDAERYLMPENFDKVPEHKHFDNLDLDTVMEELAKINQKTTNGRKHDFHGDLDIPSGQAVTVVEEKIIAAIKLFIEQSTDSNKYLGEEGKSCFSKEFADAMQTLSSNKHIFLNLLKDPNSVLIERIQNLKDARIERGQTPCSLPGSNLSEEKPISLNSDEFSSRKHGNFFRRRSTSLESYPVGGNKNGQSSSKIVILKPGPAARSPETDINVNSISLQSHCIHNKDRNERNTSQFSFSEIKRKLRHAMGKERQGKSPDDLIVKFSSKHQNGNNGDKGDTGENFLWSSPNRNHFYTERFTKSSNSFKKGEQVGKSKVHGSAIVDETSQYPRLRVSNIYIEAKKHLSEMLNNGDENAESMTEQLHKSLGRILSLPEYNSSPCCSPRRHGADIFITTHMRLSPRGNAKNNMSGVLQENHNNHPSPSRQDLESEPRISGSSSNDKVQSLGTNINAPIGDDPECSLEIQSLTKETTISEVPSSLLRVVEIEETIESRSQEEEKLNGVSSESSSNSIIGDIQNGDIREVYNGENASKSLKNSSPCFNLDLYCEDRISSSPTASPARSTLSREIEVSECVNDKVERPSPVSVLEPLFTDDDISPASTKSQSDIQPRHIHFEDQSLASDHGICTRISLEDEESAFEYVEAVLLGSGLIWDEFLSRWLSLYEILDSSLFDEVELFSSRARHDQKLLFDCANDALKEVCESYFGGFTGISCDKQNIRPVSKGMDLIHEVWKHVEWNLFQHQPPHSLEQLIKRDMARSGKWMNLRSDIELIGYEMWKTIFDDLVEDTVLSFVDDTSDHEFKMGLEPESDAIKYINSKFNQLTAN